jgi:GT2 family glycosyltransferase
MTAGPRVLAIVLNWNGYAHTLRCLAHLERQTFAALDVLVIDNGSTDDSATRLAADCMGRRRFLDLRQNLGFAGGMNRGVREALQGGYDLAWLLNNDAFPDAACLAVLVAAMDADPRLAVVSPCLYGSDGVEQHAGGRVDLASGEQEYLNSAQLSGPLTLGDWLTGTAMLARVPALHELGDFDQRFFAYWEDVDLLMRFARKGRTFRAVPEARCLHLGGASTAGSPFGLYMYARNTWLFVRKHLRPPNRLRALLRMTANQLEQAGMDAITGRRHKAEAVIAGIVAGATRRYGKPMSIRCVGLIERCVLAHPWFAARWLRAASSLLPTKGRAR